MLPPWAAADCVFVVMAQNGATENLVKMEVENPAPLAAGSTTGVEKKVKNQASGVPGGEGQLGRVAGGTDEGERGGIVLGNAALKLGAEGRVRSGTASWSVFNHGNPRGNLPTEPTAPGAGGQACLKGIIKKKDDQGGAAGSWTRGLGP